MVNFKPMHDELLWIIDTIIQENHIKGPFLDAGGGRGDISFFLSKKGFAGKYVDFSDIAVVHAKNTLKDTNVIIYNKDILDIKEKFNLILNLATIEHAPNDKEIVKHLYNLLNDDGYFIITVPVKMKEWRQDDDSYGHLRRYEIDEIKQLLKDANFDISLIWDFTFPVFWLMRRTYLKLLKSQNDKLQDATEKTKMSGLDRKVFNFFNKYLGFKFLWYPIWRINFAFRKYLWGHELLILAQKKGNKKK